MDNFRLHVEAERVLQLLSSQIYDSPLAMLRENVQNAYDATLMRVAEHGGSVQEFPIHLRINGNVVEIVDQGVGMTLDVLKGNYWSAGSSGKNTELARRAGVVGTFGIGAMANFGVASRLEVETQVVGTEHRLCSGVRLENLTLDEDCIELKVMASGDAGTIVRATLQDAHIISPADAINYLLPFVRYLDTPVYVNEQLLSQQDFFEEGADSNEELAKTVVRTGQLQASIQVSVNLSTSSVRVRSNDVQVGGRHVGRISLRQDGRSIDGLRSGFRLAGLPVSSQYNWGGKVDVTFLTPTAGREALARESIEVGSRLIAAIDEAISGVVAESAHGDQNAGFLQYIKTHRKLALAGNVTIKDASGKDLKLSSLSAETGAHFYRGADKPTIEQFSSGMTLLLISNRQPRKWIQDQWLKTKRIPEIPDHARVTKVYDALDLSRDELALKMRIETILSEDYLLARPSLLFADISHNVSIVVDSDNPEELTINLRRGGPGIPELLQLRSTSPQLFGPFTKDFVRNYIFRHVQDLVPSATRQGAEELKRLLNRRKELYRYESEDIGSLDPLLEKFLEGAITLEDVVKNRGTTRYVGRQSLSANQVGTIEAEIPTLSHSDAAPPSDEPGYAMPGILRLETDTKMKVLVAGSELPQLAGFKTFVGLTNRVSLHEKDFFIAPHHTRVIWAQHRVVFVFQHAAGDLSFYYDLELRDPLQGPPGGREIQTTTLLTKSRIFVPVPPEIEGAFSVSSGSREFYVRYDYV